MNDLDAVSKWFYRSSQKRSLSAIFLQPGAGTSWVYVPVSVSVGVGWGAGWGWGWWTLSRFALPRRIRGSDRLRYQVLEYGPDSLSATIGFLSDSL